MTIEREAPPAPEVVIRQLSERCAKLERLLEAALETPAEADPVTSNRVWREAARLLLAPEYKLTSQQKVHLTELCQSIGINAFMAKSYIMVASSIHGPELEKLAIALHTNPLSLSLGEQA